MNIQFNFLYVIFSKISKYLTYVKLDKAKNVQQNIRLLTVIKNTVIMLFLIRPLQQTIRNY